MNEFKFFGTITQILPIESGNAKTTGKEWKKLTFVVEESKDKYPQKMAFTMMDANKIADFEKYNKVGQEVEVSFNLNAREFNGRWFPDVNAWNVFSSKGGNKQEKKTESVSQETFNSKVDENGLTQEALPGDSLDLPF